MTRIRKSRTLKALILALFLLIALAPVAVARSGGAAVRTGWASVVDGMSGRTPSASFGFLRASSNN